MSTGEQDSNYRFLIGVLLYKLGGNITITEEFMNSVAESLEGPMSISIQRDQVSRALHLWIDKPASTSAH